MVEVGNIEKSFIFILSLIVILIYFYCEYYLPRDIQLNWFYLNLFLFVMRIVLLRISSSWLRVFLAWDGLGVTRFFLVIFYNNWDSISGAMVTVITNRLGDVMLFLVVIVMISQYRSPLTRCAIFVLLVSSITKSAQFPFSSWLPKAIAAPTPVRSLVHRSTLVTAGLFLLLKFKTALYLNQRVTILCLFGALTILLASLLALREVDLKRIIALSTLSQIGFLVFSLGLLNLFSTLLHLISHALFKSCLFINIGFLIHQNFRQQDQRNYRIVEIRRFVQLQIIVCLIALCGLCFTRGFVSKEIIVFVNISFRIKTLWRVVLYFSIFRTFLYRLRIIKRLERGFNRSLARSSSSLSFVISTGVLSCIRVIIIWGFVSNFISIPINYVFSDFLVPLRIFGLRLFWQQKNFFVPDILFMDNLVQWSQLVSNNKLFDSFNNRFLNHVSNTLRNLRALSNSVIVILQRGLIVFLVIFTVSLIV